MKFNNKKNQLENFSMKQTVQRMAEKIHFKERIS